LRDFRSTESLIPFSRIGHIQPKHPLRDQEEPELKAQRQVILVHVFCHMARPCSCRAKGKVLDEVGVAAECSSR
jgi:hypothetical protein